MVNGTPAASWVYNVCICKSSLLFDAADVMPEDEYVPDTATYELW